MQLNKCYRVRDDYCLVVDRWPLVPRSKSAGTRLPILVCKNSGLTTATRAEARHARRAPQSKCPRNWLKKHGRGLH